MLYRLLWLTIGPPIRIYWRVRAFGRGNVPRHGGFIAASNHRAAIDPILVCMSFARTVVWLAKVELVRNLRVSWFFRMAQVIPVDRNQPDDVWMEMAARALRRGKIFGIFPEGTRSPDGRVYKGYTGMARLAHKTGAAVVPTGVVGTDRSHQKGRRFAKPVKTEVHFGKPMYFELGPEEDPSIAYHRFTDEVLDAVAVLIRTERVPDRYSRAPARKTPAS